MSQHYPLYFNMIVLVLMVMMKSVKTHITDRSFDKLEPGQSIMGRIREVCKIKHSMFHHVRFLLSFCKNIFRLTLCSVVHNYLEHTMPV